MYACLARVRFAVKWVKSKRPNGMRLTLRAGCAFIRITSRGGAIAAGCWPGKRFGVPPFLGHMEIDVQGVPNRLKVMM